MIRVVRHDEMSFNTLVYKIKEGLIAPLVCQDCGCVMASLSDCTHLVSHKPPLPQCPCCTSDHLVVARKDNLQEAFYEQYPWRLCGHCGYYFLHEEEIARLITPEPAPLEPGVMGCPNCRRLGD